VPPIRVVIADDHPLVREALRRLMQTSKDLTVTAETETAEETLAAVLEHRPDVLLLDLELPDGHGLDLLPKLPAETQVIVLTGQDNRHYKRFALRAGAAGFLTKNTASDELLEAVLRVSRGEYIGPKIDSVNDGPLAQLTPRQLQIMKQIALGERNASIALSLGLTVRTVDSHRYKILQKLRLKNNVELTRYAIRSGLIEN